MSVHTCLIKGMTTLRYGLQWSVIRSALSHGNGRCQLVAVASVRFRWCSSLASCSAGSACALRLCSCSCSPLPASCEAAYDALRPQSAQSVPRVHGTRSTRPQPDDQARGQVDVVNVAQSAPPKAT